MNEQNYVAEISLWNHRMDKGYGISTYRVSTFVHTGEDIEVRMECLDDEDRAVVLNSLLDAHMDFNVFDDGTIYICAKRTQIAGIHWNV